MEGGDEYGVARPEVLRPRIVSDRDAEFVSRVDHLLYEVGVRNEVGGRADSFVEAGLCDKQPDDSLAASGVLLYDQILLVPAVEPLLQNLALFQSEP